jgi:hypothetical protein
MNHRVIGGPSQTLGELGEASVVFRTGAPPLQQWERQPRVGGYTKEIPSFRSGRDLELADELCGFRTGSELFQEGMPRPVTTIPVAVRKNCSVARVNSLNAWAAACPFTWSNIWRSISSTDSRIWRS